MSYNIISEDGNSVYDSSADENSEFYKEETNDIKGNPNAYSTAANGMNLEDLNVLTEFKPLFYLYEFAKFPL